MKIAFPERSGSRVGAVPFDAAGAAGAARMANLSGFLLLTDIRCWDSDSHAPLRSRVEFRLVRIDDGTIGWQHRAKKNNFFGGRLEQPIVCRSGQGNRSPKLWLVVPLAFTLMNALI